jgi:hypothetical protein
LRGANSSGISTLSGVSISVTVKLRPPDVV